ncbi:hypothetical protein B0T17DRAFT_490606, partial [Bombardia bombarda]
PSPGTTIKRRKPADPLVARKKPLPRPQFMRPPGETNPKNGDKSEDEKDPILDPLIAQLQANRQRNGGWSEQAPYPSHEFPLVTTKRELMEGIRHHIMHFSKGPRGDATWDVTNQDQFPRPVTLHRRDPRLPPANRMIVKDDHGSANPEDDAEAEHQRQLKAEREAQRALDQAQIAPAMKPNEPKQKQVKKEKASSFYGRNSEAQKKQTGLRYEETLPWHLEDADNKSGVWVGSYIAGLSDVHCAMVIDGPKFRMIPLERYYSFDQKPKFDTLTLDDAENMMKQNKDVKRWVMLDREKQDKEKEKDETRQFLRGKARVKTESATSRSAPKTERQDDNELDFSGDEFQDDDETPGFQADDEDSKEAKDRIRREQIAANLFGEGEEEKVDEEEKEEQMEKLKRKTIGKKTKKTLIKLEHDMNYHSSDSEDADNNPFTEESESESESEDKKDEDSKDEKKDDELKKQSDQKDQGAKGTAAGSTGKPKTSDSKKGKKRPGSPNLSDSSGNESSNHKKVKTSKGTSSKVPSRSGTPLPGRPKPTGGAMSDGEATAGEGSDGGLRIGKKIKSSKTGLSRAGSPASPRIPGSPKLATNRGTSTLRGSPPPNQAAPKIELREIAEAIGAAENGIGLSDLLRKFHGRIDRPGTITRAEWIQLIKLCAEFGPADKLLRLKASWTANQAGGA